MIKHGKCEDCKHYKEEYCILMDELVKPLDNCGMYDGEQSVMSNIWLMVDNGKCDLCRTCEQNCPTDAITITQNGTFIHEKEVCAYDEVCEDICPNEALRIIER